MQRTVIKALVILTFFFSQFPAEAIAKVTRLEVLSKAKYGLFKSGEYTRLDIGIAGELSPSAEKIPDLDKASRNAAGMVEYSTKLILIMPTEAGRGNGALLIDVPNRGRSLSSSLYNSPRV